MNCFQLCGVYIFPSNDTKILQEGKKVLPSVDEKLVLYERASRTSRPSERAASLPRSCACQSFVLGITMVAESGQWLYLITSQIFISGVMLDGNGFFRGGFENIVCNPSTLFKSSLFAESGKRFFSLMLLFCW